MDPSVSQEYAGWPPGFTRPTPRNTCRRRCVAHHVIFGSRAKSTLPTPETALSGRSQRPFAIARDHAVLHTPLEGPWPKGTEVLYIAMGCFWGAERIFWQLPGVVATAAGYMGGL